jgi:predicted dehydrogenase
VRYAIVGAGGRAIMYADALAGRFAESARLVALCDPSPTRMRFHTERLTARYGAAPVPSYHPEQFDDLVKEQRPDTVIVTTVDAVHHDYVIRAMEAGCDVVCEKPLTTTAHNAAAVLDAVERTGRELRMTFNYRYSSAYSRVRQAVVEGVVGTPSLVDFSWLLDTRHGADYFRRWHRDRESSGGLLVHKSSHHFDLVNWWIGAWPTRVAAMGGLRFYGRDNAARRGVRHTYDRYTDEPAAADDPFALSLRSHPALEGLYLDAEADSGYLRDRNVFGDGITIEDTMAVTAAYDNGAFLSYSLVAYSPWEGLRVAITGDRGRLELYDRHGSHLVRGQDDTEIAVEQEAGAQQALWHFPIFGEPQRLDIPPAIGGHGGGDDLLLEQLFSPEPPPDPLGRGATHLDGAAALAAGLAANASIETGQVVDVAALIGLRRGRS